MKTVYITLAIVLGAYAIFILGLLLTGKKSMARAIAGFIPDCIILFKNLLKDSRVPSRYKYLLFALIAYLALPIDIIPDFIPVVGQLDDAILAALVLRIILKGAGTEIVTENWKGSRRTLDTILGITRLK